MNWITPKAFRIKVGNKIIEDIYSINLKQNKDIIENLVVYADGIHIKASKFPKEVKLEVEV